MDSQGIETRRYLAERYYTYDAADQIKEVVGLPTVAQESNVSNAEVNENNQYNIFNGEPLTYDASGNLRTKGAVTYTWDIQDRLVGITGPDLTASFSYDALGRRASRTVNSQVLSYKYDGSDILSDGSAEYLHGIGIDDVLSRTTATTSEYYLKDYLGSTVSLTNNAGNITVQYGYSPFGQVTKTGSTSNYFTYTGREDDGTGLYFYRARYYSPEQKRFLAEDPLGLGGGDSNYYAYVSNDPISRTDPSGLAFGLDDAIAIGFIAGAVSGGLSTYIFERSAGTPPGQAIQKAGIAALGGGLTGALAPLAAAGILTTEAAIATLPTIGGVANIASQSVGRGLPNFGQGFAEFAVGAATNTLGLIIGYNADKAISRLPITEAAKFLNGQGLGIALAYPFGVFGNAVTTATASQSDSTSATIGAFCLLEKHSSQGLR